MINVKSVCLGELGNNCYLLTDVQSGKAALVDCTDASEKMLSLLTLVIPVRIALSKN